MAEYRARRRRLPSVKHHLVLLISSSAIGIATAAGAQTAAPAPQESSGDQADAPNGIGDIIVTAQRRSENINKVGISINAISGDALASQGITGTADLARVVSGFKFTPSAYGPPVYQLRGIGFYDTSIAAAPTVSLYVDEVPLPLSIMSTAATLDVERIEVLKGPQGTLYGQNSTGGAINYIAAKPTSTLKYGMDATYGRFDQGGASAFISGPLTDTLRARAAVRWDHSGNWQNSYTRDDKRGEGNVLTGRLLLDWTPTDRLTINTNVTGFLDRSDNQAPQLVAIITPNAPAALRAFPLPPADARAADWDPAQPFRRDVRFIQGSLRTDYALSDAIKLTSITAADYLSRRNQGEADGTAIPNFAVDTPGHSTNFSQELRVGGKTGAAQFVFGGNYSYDNIYDEASLLDGSVSTFPFSKARAVSKQSVNTYAVFGDVDLKVLPGLTLTGGVRYTNQHRAFAGCAYDVDGRYAKLASSIATARTGQTVVIPQGGCVTLGTNFVPGVQHLSLNQDNVSWKLGVTWEATPDALLYANVTRGYKSGAFPALGATFVQQFSPAVQESVLAYEAGYKLTLFNRALQFNGAAFYYDYSNKQLRGKRVDPVLGALNGLINVPKSSIAGFELQATLRPVTGLSINAGATYTDSKIKGDFTNYNALAQLQNFRDQRLPLVPQWQANMDMQYEFPISDGTMAVFGGGMNYESSTNGGLGQIALFNIRPYTLFDMRAGIRSSDERWRITAFVHNLTDKYYVNLVTLPGPDAVTQITGLPRTYGITVGFRY